MGRREENLTVYVASEDRSVVLGHRTGVDVRVGDVLEIAIEPGFRFPRLIRPRDDLVPVVPLWLAVQPTRASAAGCTLLELPSPWDTCPAALRSAGAIVPWRNTPRGPQYRPDLHGTGFFISRSGLFLSAAHVFEFSAGEKTVDICLLHASVGLIPMRVVQVVKHPTHDLALGVAVVEKEYRAFIHPMKLATTALSVGAQVAVLGYPETQTTTDEELLVTRLRFSPDFYEA